MPAESRSDDRHLADGEFTARIAAITNAFGDPTRREIYLFAREREHGVTATEVGERFGLHVNVARHHLDKLATAGHLDVSVGRVEGAGAGRPSKRYIAHDPDLDVEPTARKDDLLVMLLGRALALLPEADALDMAQQVGLEYGRSLATQLAPGDGHRNVRTALHAVADMLTAHGFAAHAEARGGSLRIVADACPFGDMSSQHPVICAVDRGIVQGMLEVLGHSSGEPLTELSRAAGDDSCVTRL